MIKVTKVAIDLSDEAPLVAYANVVLNDEFMVHGIRVVRKQNGALLMLMPSRRNKSGDNRDVAHPLTMDCRRRIESAVMPRVTELLSQGGGSVEQKAMAAGPR